jgi:hypothetical protein
MSLRPAALPLEWRSSYASDKLTISGQCSDAMASATIGTIRGWRWRQAGRAHFRCSTAKEHFIFSVRAICRSRPRKAAEILGFRRVTRGVGFVACVALGRICEENRIQA